MSRPLLLENETHKLIGMCMEVHRQLGHGFLEIVYKDAIQLELINESIEYEREKEYDIWYKGVKLLHKFYADFVVYNKVILEVKCAKSIADEHISQIINYLKVSENQVGLIINFGRHSLEWKRVVY